MEIKRAQEIYKQNILDYDSIAEAFSLTRNREWPEFEAIKKNILGGQKVLDLGCGNGRFYEATKDLNIDYQGVDASKGLIAEAQKKYGNSGKFLVGDILNLPFADQDFDIIVSLAVLHHIPSQELRDKALKEIKRVLKDDGLFILTVWNLWQPKYEKYIVKNDKEAEKANLDIGDSMIPWQNKTNRYYHAFKEEEFKKYLSQEFEMITFLKTDFNFLVVVKKSS